MLANEIELLKPPQFVAFRTMDGYWFSRFTPEGAFREVPVDHVVDLGGDDDAGKLIDLIRGGRDLPVEFVQRLHVID